MRNYLLTVLVLSLSFTGLSQAQDQQADSELKTLINKALESEQRTEAEKDRDRNRKPLKTLEFFGITPDMKVLELLPGGGWYTKLLAPTLSDKGELHLALGANYVKDNVLEQAGFDKVKVIDVDAQIADGDKPRLRTINKFDFSEKGFDAVLTFRNMHNFDATGRNNVNTAVFRALKPGGVYGVVDHTLRHMEPFTAENRRRADPVVIIKELLDLGFEFVAHSDLHYRPDDELRYEVGRKSVTGNTDRFTFLFRKPK